MFPEERQVIVATLPQESEAIPEQPSEWSRISNCVSPGATDATMSDHVGLSARPTACSVPSRGSGRVEALQPKPHDDQRAQTVTGLLGPACVTRIWRKHPAGTARAEAGLAVSLREVPGFSRVGHEGGPVKLRLTWSRPTCVLSSNSFFFFFQREVLLQTV